MFSTLSRYVTGHYWAQGGIYLGIGVAMIWLQQMLRLFTNVSDQGQSFLTLIGLTSLFIPLILQTLIPIALMLSVATALSTLNRRHELHIIHLADRHGDIFRATILYGLVAAIIMLINGLFLVPTGLAEVRARKVAISADTIARAQRVGTFLTLEKGLTLLVDSRRPNGEMEGFFIHDSRNPAYDVTYQAEAATLIDNGDTFVLALKTGSLQQTNPATGLMQEVVFDIYSLDLTELFAQDILVETRLREKSTAELIDLWTQNRENPVSVTVSNSGQKTEKTFDRAAVQKEIHARLALPLFAIGLPLMAYAFSGFPRLTRKRRIPSELIVFLAGFAFLGLEQATEAIALENRSSFWVIYSVPVFVILLSFALIYGRTNGWRLQASSYFGKAPQTNTREKRHAQ